jgi:nitrite reductase (NO-forming)/hydroxylamine reductase
MTKAEFDASRQIYFDRCAGCHGVLRKGATGKALLPHDMQKLGTETLKVFIALRHPRRHARLRHLQRAGEKEVDLMARYIQHPAPTPPEWGMKEMAASWKLLVKPEDQRPKKQMNKLEARQPVRRHPA